MSGDRYAELLFNISPITQKLKELNALVGWTAFGIEINSFQAKRKDGKIIAAKFGYIGNHTLAKAANLWFQYQCLCNHTLAAFCNHTLAIFGL